MKNLCGICGKDTASVRIRDVHSTADGYVFPAKIYDACEGCMKKVHRVILDQKGADCCDAWVLSAEADTEDAGGHLRTRSCDRKHKCCGSVPFDTGVTWYPAEREADRIERGEP